MQAPVRSGGHPRDGEPVAAAWALTGTPSRTPGQHLLIWRGAQQDDRSEVVAALMPAGPGPPG
jgi:hypothetical protein